MASQTKNCGTATNRTGSSWSFLSNITASDNSYVSAIVDATPSNYLNCTNFGFSIPANATINGIMVGVERTKSGSVWDYAAVLINADGSGGDSSSNLSTGAAWSNTESVHTFGGPTADWGSSWTPSKINSSNFGFAISAYGVSDDYTYDTAYIDTVQITVYYSANVYFGSTEINKIYFGSNEINYSWFGGNGIF